VLNNRDLNQVTWEQRALEGDPKYPATQSIPDFPYAQFAELIGLAGRRIEDPSEIAGAWDEAFAADRPFVLEAVTDPEIPPLPPHISLEQAKHFAQASLKDPDRGAMIRHSFQQMVKDILPTRK
jgi:pyruvate dehydrogenase (quinone)